MFLLLRMLEIEVSTSYTNHGHSPSMKVKSNEITAVPLHFSEKHLKPSNRFDSFKGVGGF